MKCKACDQILNQIELSRKDRETDLFIDLCGKCLTYSNEASYNYSIDLETDVDEVTGDSPWLTQH